MWRKWAPRGYRILRISHILHANPGSQASGFPWLPQTPRELPESRPRLSRIAARGNVHLPLVFQGVNAHDHGCNPMSRISNHTSPAKKGWQMIVGQNFRYQGKFDPR